MTFDAQIYAQNRTEKPFENSRKKGFPFLKNPLPSIYGHYPKQCGTNPLYQWSNRFDCFASNRNN